MADETTYYDAEQPLDHNYTKMKVEQQLWEDGEQEEAAASKRMKQHWISPSLKFKILRSVKSRPWLWFALTSSVLFIIGAIVLMAICIYLLTNVSLAFVARAKYRIISDFEE